MSQGPPGGPPINNWEGPSISNREMEKPAGPRWADPRKNQYNFNLGDLTVQCMGATITKAHADSPSGMLHYDSKDPLLVIGVRLENNSKTRRIFYRTLSNSQVSDEHGNVYRCHTGGLSVFDWKGELRSADLYPGKEAIGLISFDRPVDAAMRFRLELRADGFAGSVARFEIPREMLLKRDE
jgi:hypothetical protein